MLSQTRHVISRLSSSINIGDATAPQIISYHPQQQLLPLVLAHCNYSLMVGQGTNIDYDYRGLEQAIEERFVKNRQRLLPIVSLWIKNEQTN